MSVKLTDEMIKGAQESEAKYGVPASITLAQIMLESGGNYDGGLSQLAVEGKNLFGVKGTGTAGSIYLPTNEEKGGVSYVEIGKFRKYNTYAESIDDHGKLLTNDYYSQYLSNAASVQDWARGLSDAGYATDKSYSKKLMNIIDSNNLTQYDKGAAYYNKNDSLSSSDDDKFKWYGDIVRFIFIILIIVLAVVLFMQAFDIKIGGIL